MSTGRLMVNWTVVCSEHGTPLVRMPDGSIRCPCSSIDERQQVIVCATVVTPEGAIAAIGESVASCLAAAGYEVRKKDAPPAPPAPPKIDRKDWS